MENEKCTPQMLLGAIEQGIHLAWRTKAMIDDIPALSYKAKYPAESLLEMAYKLGLVSTPEPNDIVRAMEDLGIVRFAINGEIKTYYIWNLLNIRYKEENDHTLYVLPNLTVIQEFLNDYDRIMTEYKLTSEFAKLCCDGTVSEIPDHIVDALETGGWTSDNCKELNDTFDVDSEFVEKLCDALKKVEKHRAELSEIWGSEKGMIESKE